MSRSSNYLPLATRKRGAGRSRPPTATKMAAEDDAILSVKRLLTLRIYIDAQIPYS